MSQNATICVGTLGQGIWRSSDGGATWLRVRHGLYSESCGATNRMRGRIAIQIAALHRSDRPENRPGR
jgi:hypothetical protein